jgi:hypothetical protein
MDYRLLTEFRRIFDRREYRHRSSGQGDFVATQLYEDLIAVGKSTGLLKGITEKSRVLNLQNTRRGIAARRGDASFGEIIPGQAPAEQSDCRVARGPIATVEIGVEVKILAKAMIKQIDRVIGDLRKQVDHFRRGSGTPICIAVVGINSAQECTSYEGDRSYRTDGRKHKHPCQEAAAAERRLLADAAPVFDEFLILRFRATNAAPFPFEWTNYDSTSQDYGAILTRVSREYDRRF